jgi:hypothetical protein
MRTPEPRVRVPPRLLAVPASAAMPFERRPAQLPANATDQACERSRVGTIDRRPRLPGLTEGKMEAAPIVTCQRQGTQGDQAR